MNPLLDTDLVHVTAQADGSVHAQIDRTGKLTIGLGKSKNTLTVEIPRRGAGEFFVRVILGRKGCTTAYDLHTGKGKRPVLTEVPALSGAAPVAGTCRICGCIEGAACEGGCSWADESKTLCNNPACLEAAGKEQVAAR